MTKYYLKNIPLKQLIWFIEDVGCNLIRTSGGHFIYSRKDLLRPIVLQSHIDPVPEFIAKQIIKTLGHNAESYTKYLKDNY